MRSLTLALSEAFRTKVFVENYEGKTEFFSKDQIAAAK